MLCNIDFITLTIWCQECMPSGAAEDLNLIEICVMKVVKCHHLNLTFDILSIVLCDCCTQHQATKGNGYGLLVHPVINAL